MSDLPSPKLSDQHDQIVVVRAVRTGPDHPDWKIIFPQVKKF